MEASTAQTFMWVISGLTAALFFAVTGWVIRLRNQAAIGTGGDHPDGRMIMEIWGTDGTRRGYLVNKKPGGFEVKPPKGLEQAVRYFYDKNAVGRVKYPSWMPFDFLRVDAPIASWYENHASAMNPVGGVETREVVAEKDYVKGDRMVLQMECVHVEEAIGADMQRSLQMNDVIGAGDELLRDGEDSAQAVFRAIQSIKGLKYLPWIAGASAIGTGVVIFMLNNLNTLLTGGG